MLKMKNVIKAAVVTMLAGMVLSGSNTMAQNKFGHINVGLLLSLMPEAKDADKKISDFYQTLQVQLKTMNTELQSKYEAYQKDAKTLSDAAKQTREKELTDLQERMQKLQADDQQQAQAKQGEFMQPVLDKARTAVQDVARENKFTYIFDTSKGEFIIVPDSDDILPLVKRKLGITAATPTASTAGTGTGAPSLGPNRRANK